MSIFSSKRAKKAAQLKKNRHLMELFNVFRLRALEAERVKKNTEKQAAKPADYHVDDAVSDKVATIRNRLTGKKRTSRERWNRFAGTEGGGGRGL